jgi:hypothetical protein
MGDFLICSFPRSRTLWLSHYLGIPGKSVVTHEACEFAGSAKEFWSNADALRPPLCHYGNSDSANIFVLPALLAERPMTKVIWINRNIVDVVKSMKKVGVPMEEKAANLMICLRNRYCAYFDLTVNFDDLGLEHIIRMIWEFLMPDIPFDPLRYRRYNAQNICYSKDNPMLKKDTKKFIAWVNEELSQTVEK